MNYKAYSAKEFALDESFRAWVKGNNPVAMAFWEKWTSEHPEKQKEIEEARYLLTRLNYTPDKLSGEEFATLRSRILTTAQAVPQQKLRTFSFYRWAVAVAILGVFTVSYLLIERYFQSNQARVYATDYGETKRILLPDSSTVILNANSKLTIAQDWSISHRKVWLDGEAFFDIHKITAAQNASTFTVYTGAIMVEVLGTKFNVHNRQGNTKVVLNTGKVKLKAKTQQHPEIEMLPGDQVTFSEQQKTFEIQRVNAEDYSAWTQHQLVFRNATLSEIAATLRDNYGLHTVMKDPSLDTLRFTGTTPTDDLDMLFTKLSRLFSVEITQNKNQIIIEKQ